MTDQRIYNFNAGPAALPLSVLEEIQASFLNFKNSGMSIIEISHRSSYFDEVINDAVVRAKRLLKLDDRYHVLFLQGGASLQFAMIPMNLLSDGDTADYINTGTWSTKAIAEAQKMGKTIRVAASSEDKNFSYIPKGIAFNPDAKFVHLTSNNTIKGTQFYDFPDTGGIPIIADMSSDIFSRPLDMEKFGLIYAGAQKNLGPSGTCMVIIRKDLLATANEDLPTMLKYSTHANKNSMYNTPPCFGIYTIDLVLKWIEEEMGGIEGMEEHNIKKADILYDFIDASSFYQTTAEKYSRSLMNVTFRLPSETLEKVFVERATNHGLGGLKGHRSVGGCRASIYNAATMESMYALVEFMESFEKENKS
ncbi:MAG: 3-phosphoserine/phosphohydroxythreonine transaminase [Proteobacteria bacterium]|nr:3-phosphoserine/phosphohydroxythreonine transaminase [Desulfobacula sp.]MBU3952365.1 3-phosphoserine/phosphohydroxythreonine transaminase [Pseudomonadota bacterium]MBU4131817.1 3-phosphoserine/phosphohydroxythreonine transaminase [Pseudomonadota bacterium]